jgi:hypothetical protein
MLKFPPEMDDNAYNFNNFFILPDYLMTYI